MHHAELLFRWSGRLGGWRMRMSGCLLQPHRGRHIPGALIVWRFSSATCFCQWTCWTNCCVTLINSSRPSNVLKSSEANTRNIFLIWRGQKTLIKVFIRCHWKLDACFTSCCNTVHLHSSIKKLNKTTEACWENVGKYLDLINLWSLKKMFPFSAAMSWRQQIKVIQLVFYILM